MYVRGIGNETKKQGGARGSPKMQGYKENCEVRSRSKDEALTNYEVARPVHPGPQKASRTLALSSKEA
jgi:hypothetical protein